MVESAAVRGLARMLVVTFGLTACGGGSSPTAPSSSSAPTERFEAAPICAASTLPRSSDVRIRTDVTRFLGGSSGLDAWMNAEYRQADGVYEIAVEWMNPNAMLTLQVSTPTLGGAPQDGYWQPLTAEAGLKIARTGRTTLHACWDSVGHRDFPDGRVAPPRYLLRLQQRSDLSERSIRVTRTHQAAALCGPVGCSTPAN